MFLRNLFERFGIWIFVILALGAILFITQCTNCSQPNADELLNQSILQLQKDSLTFYRNKNNEQIAKITTLQGSVDGFLKANFEKDSTLQSLKSTVSDYEKRLVTATALLEEANMKVTASTIDICDTTFLTSMDTIYLIQDEWAEVAVTPTEESDSLEFDIKLRNEIHLWHQYGKRPGLFKPRPLVVFALQKSPYFQTEEIKSLVVPPPPRKKGRWIVPTAVTATIVAIIAAKR